VPRKKTPQDYHILAEKRGFEWLGPEVANVLTKTWWHCSEGHEWEAHYSHIKEGSGCPYCTGKSASAVQNIIHKKIRTPKDYHILAKNRNIKWLGPRVSSVRLKTWWECSKKHKWEARYYHIKQNTKCPYCSILETQSKGEKRIAKFLDALDIMYSRQKIFEGCKDKAFLRFDFFFTYSGQRFLIEYNGQQHYKPIGHWGGKEALETSKRRDRIKAHFAATNGLHLIIIPYTDYDRTGTIIIDRLKEVTGENPLTFVDRIRAARGVVECMEGIQLSFGLERWIDAT
jgi:hypothetical protein